MTKKAGIPISPKQLAVQWRHLPNKLAVNCWNFEVKAGKAAVEIFKESFDLGRLNSTVSRPWRPRRDSKPHPILDETSSLRNSIKWRHQGSRSQTSGVRIYTDPKGFKNSARHRGFCYAAIHNDPSGSHTYGNTGVRSIQRQYIGHSTVLKRKLESLSSIIFEGFPKSN
jgi:hypothetical protein